MEILSIGQKIKRARIYKGYTLKELCGDKISVSKLSCIENDKIKPDDEIIDIISNKLDIDPIYIKAGVKEQLMDNINKLKEAKDIKNWEETLEYNLKYAEEYKYFSIAFYLIHLIFNYYLENNEIEKIQLIISKYYDYWLKSGVEENKLIYYMDIAKFFYNTKEYIEAASYYKTVRQIANNKKNHILLAQAIYDESSCYMKINEYEKAYEIAFKLIDLIDFLDSNVKKAKVYTMLAVLSLRLDRKNFRKYEEKAYKLYENDLVDRANATFKFANVMFKIGENGKAIDYVDKALSLYPKDTMNTFVAFMLDNMEILLKNNVLYKAHEISEKILNYAIQIDNLRYIERSYYYKALILSKENNYLSAETYMNLSLDSLLKFGTRQQIYERYMTMGNMYHKMGQTGEAIKYFNLALKINKNM